MRRYPKRNYNHLKSSRGSHIQLNIDSINGVPKILINGKDISHHIVSVDYMYRTNEESIRPHKLKVVYYEQTKDGIVRRTTGESNLYDNSKIFI